MEFFSPKDAFVAEIFVSDKSHVKAGTLIIQLDSEEEEKQGTRVKTMQSVRELMASQYTGHELANTRRLAEIAVHLAEQTIKVRTDELNVIESNYRAGKVQTVDYTRALVARDTATLQLEKAKTELAKFDFGVARNQKISDLIKQYTAFEEQYVATRRAHLQIASPLKGIVSLAVAKGSFVELGGALFSIDDQQG